MEDFETGALHKKKLEGAEGGERKIHETGQMKWGEQKTQDGSVSSRKQETRTEKKIPKKTACS